MTMKGCSILEDQIQACQPDPAEHQGHDEKLASKQEKFKELATKRTNEICHKIQLLGKLANRNSYAYDDPQVKLIFTTLEEQLHLAQEKFQAADEMQKSFISL